MARREAVGGRETSSKSGGRRKREESWTSLVSRVRPSRRQLLSRPVLAPCAFWFLPRQDEKAPTIREGARNFGPTGTCNAASICRSRHPSWQMIYSEGDVPMGRCRNHIVCIDVKTRCRGSVARHNNPKHGCCKRKTVGTYEDTGKCMKQRVKHGVSRRGGCKMCCSKGHQQTQC